MKAAEQRTAIEDLVNFYYRSHLKNAKWPDLYSSCCPGERPFQPDSSDEFPTGGREFITAFRRP
jgi:hypothetical protein